MTTSTASRSLRIVAGASIVACLWWTTACGRPAPPPGVGGCVVSPPEDHDPASGAGFSWEHLLCVSVEMDPQDFELMRNQDREILPVFTNDCSEPWGSPFTWFAADMTVDGVGLDHVGIRQKGFLGSLNPAKPSLKIKTDRYIDDQRLGDDTRLTFNNVSQEPTRLRTCLGFWFFELAGVPAPRCNFASVEVNGEPLGPYAHVEPVKAPLLRRHFGSSNGHLYEGTLTDFFVPWMPRFEAKTTDTDPSKAPLIEIALALKSEDHDLLDALEPLVNIDRLIRFWAAEALASHWDGYAAGRNNYYVYFDPDDDGRAALIPWGTDGAFQASPLNGPQEAELNDFTNGELVRRLLALPEMNERFQSEMRLLLAGVFNEERLLERVDAWAAMVDATQSDDAYATSIDELRTFISGRRAELMRMLDDGLEGRSSPGSCSPGPDGEE